MKLAAFDLETAKVLPERVDDIKRYAPLGISCAALAFSDGRAPITWKGMPQMSPLECQDLVRDLQRMVREGYTLLTWNGCAFDFEVVAQESGLVEECAALALDHVDLMLIVTFTKGWYVSLEKALQGAGIAGKVKALTLSDGTRIHDMAGSKAPQLWAQGEHAAVLEYLTADVTQLLELAKVVSERKEIRWQANTGRPQSVALPRFLTVRECFGIPEPDVSWMTDPPTRAQFVSWMPAGQRRGL
jgi:hypothetical protein